MFPSPSILQHDIELDTCTITTLEKLLGVGSLGGSIGHLIHCYVTFLIFSNGFNLPFVTQTVTHAFLGCWAMIIPMLVNHFQ
jgi:hypothetical protein